MLIFSFCEDQLHLIMPQADLGTILVLISQTSIQNIDGGILLLCYTIYQGKYLVLKAPCTQEHVL